MAAGRHLEFGETGNSAIRSADPENPTVELEVDRTTPRGYGHLKFPQYWPNEKSVGRQYILLLTLFSYTPLRYVRNVAREE